MAEKGRLWIIVIIALIAVIFVIWAAPSQYYQAQGVLLPAKQVRAATLSFSIVRLESRPIGSKLLGYIHIERRYSTKKQQAQQQIWQLAQNLAANAGANAIVINLFRVGSVTKGHYIYVFRGIALYMPNLQRSPWNGVTYNPPVGVEF